MNHCARCGKLTNDIHTCTPNPVITALQARVAELEARCKELEARLIGEYKAGLDNGGT